LVNACGGNMKTKEEIKEAWKIVLREKKSVVEFRLSVMNIYVTDPVAAAQYPEAFEIFGENVHLLGTFPLEMRIGYESDFNRLLNKPIDIRMQLINAQDYKIENRFSTIVLPDIGRKHVKGQITFRKLSGQTTGRDGDLTLSGEITLEIGTGNNKKTLTGHISVHPVAWG
ncbi:MAG: hypothetical protein K8I00_10420, partial [Candidatus Omnitrophica bacterium]|nr:hypothetical protein [Candidatus Omnitrophota bacterium]